MSDHPVGIYLHVLNIFGYSTTRLFLNWVLYEQGERVVYITPRPDILKHDSFLMQ